MRLPNPSENEQTSKPTAWKRSLIAGASACLVVFLVNLAITIWSITLPEGSQNGAQTGRRILYEGSSQYFLEPATMVCNAYRHQPGPMSTKHTQSKGG
ncbi:hypothetical protein FOMG_17375 [Fusarium oxysporum f. sp. melonis 26406]|uniref:Uncharacterized protein n=1 Tax=Fusarium oxysporum f. sp. melonis 26406 TaxID=1089452 RepID=W9Z2M7_FUSOX|nr:hypothetical protein FOMG_17375 [Fusarium oxysporum f. sp. melonis 26406]